ncbi:MAG: RHS repeat-associated core domain-containing protein [Candidatus Acidiferrales bacterium]
MITDSCGNVCHDADYYPHGGERDIADSCPQNYKFTGKERDAETNLDNFGARYYASAWARFVSPDWSGTPESVPYATFGDPQTLNLYSYVRDNPLAQADMDGHCTTVDCMALHQQQPVNEAQGQAADQTPKAQQQTANKPVGSTTVGRLEKTMTHEDGSLSTPKGGDPAELVKGKTTLANAIIDGAESSRPPQVGTPTVPASAQDAQITGDAYTNRANRGADGPRPNVLRNKPHTSRQAPQSSNRQWSSNRVSAIYRF